VNPLPRQSLPKILVLERNVVEMVVLKDGRPEIMEPREKRSVGVAE
jgi:hypothetical protein